MRDKKRLFIGLLPYFGVIKWYSVPFGVIKSDSFLENPFGVIKSDSLYVSVENIFMTNGFFGDSVRFVNSKYSNKPCDINQSKMINGGFISGHYTYVEQYLAIFLKYFTKNQSYAEDQYYFNFIYYCRKITEFKVTLLDYSDGFIHYFFHHKSINAFPPKETYPVIYLHQWNRNDCHGDYSRLATCDNSIFLSR